MILFTLGNSSDLFLIFYAQTRFGLGLGWVINLWVLLHLSKIAFSLPGGWMADRIGRSAAIMAGWVIYSAVYIAMPFVSNFGTVCALLLFYGVFWAKFGPKPAFSIGALLATAAMVVLAGSLAHGRNKRGPLQID